MSSFRDKTTGVWNDMALEKWLGWDKSVRNSLWEYQFSLIIMNLWGKGLSATSKPQTSRMWTQWSNTPTADLTDPRYREPCGQPKLGSRCYKPLSPYNEKDLLSSWKEGFFVYLNFFSTEWTFFIGHSYSWYLQISQPMPLPSSSNPCGSHS